MPWPMLIPLISSGLSFAGGLLKNKSSSRPDYGPLQGLITSLIQKRLQGSQDLSGYTAGGMQNLNHTFDLLRQSQGNDLTARGLSTSPVAGAVDATRENSRGAALAQFQNSIPLLQRQLQGEDLNLAARVLGGQQTEGGGGAAGGFENLASMLGYFYGKGAFGNRNPLIMNSGGGNGTYYEPSDTYGYG